MNHFTFLNGNKLKFPSQLAEMFPCPKKHNFKSVHYKGWLCKMDMFVVQAHIKG